MMISAKQHHAVQQQVILPAHMQRDLAHLTDLMVALSPITLLQVLKSTAAGLLSAFGVFECIAHNVHSVKMRFLLFS